MAEISIVQQHTLSPAAARTAAEQVAQRIATEYGLACQWDGDVLRFEREFIDHLRRHTSVLTDIASTGKLEDGTVSALESAVAEFSKGFQSSEEGGVRAGHEEHRAIEQDQVAQEQITKQKR